MIRNKGAASMLSLLMAVTAVALMGMSPVRQAWQINSWSVQYTRHALKPAAKQTVLTEPPAKHARAAYWLATAALQSGNPALAETLIASQAAHGDPYAMHLMGDVRLARGDFAGALAIWQQAEDVDSLLRAALQARQAGRLEEALRAYNAAWRLNSESGTLPLASFLLDYRQDYGRTENVLRQSLAAFPNSKYWPVWSNRLGDALRAQKRWDEASAVYESVIAQTPHDWAAHIGLGWTRYERGDGLQAAMSEFQEAINAPESQGNGQLAIAQALTREKRFEEADAWFAQALALNPDAWWWYIAQGNAAQQSGNLTLALAVYQEALARFPENPDDWAAHIGLGWTRYERGDGLQAAMSEFQEAINAPKSQGNGQLAIAQALTRQKRFEEADAWFAQALALNPNARGWYVARGNAAWQAGNLTLVLAVYQEALARFPDFAPAYYEIAYAYQMNEQPAQALAAIEQALVLMAPPNANYYARAGGIYEWAGDASRALHAYRQALLIDPQNAAALKGVERLDK